MSNFLRSIHTHGCTNFLFPTRNVGIYTLGSAKDLSEMGGVLLDFTSFILIIRNLENIS